ncbi:hypothetical protein K438DRAFT_1761761 [Mycena galopus ATCC 62051]|nr:hypothetical protein K438DRAFT_1761761 [Mycena galopus ATCC 62051]
MATSDDSITSRAPSLVKRIGNTVKTLLSRSPTPIPRIASPQLDPNLKPDWEAAEAWSKLFIKAKALSKKRKAEDADLVRNVPFGQSASSIYREKHFKTKNARAKVMQKSIASIFKPLAKTAQPQENEKEVDSDVEIIPDHESITVAIESVSKDMDVDSDMISHQAQTVPTFENYAAALSAAFDHAVPTPSDPALLESLRKSRTSRMRLFGIAQSRVRKPKARLERNWAGRRVGNFAQCPKAARGPCGFCASSLLPDSGIAASHCTTAVGNKPSFDASDGTESSAEPSAPSPDTSDASFDDLDRITDAAASSDGVSASTTPKQVHARLAKLIKKHEKELRKPKTMLSDKTAASKIFDLEALKRFNDLRLTYSEKIQKARKAAATAAPRMKPLMRRRIPTLQPAIAASEKVAEACGKGPSFARRLRKLAVFLAETGELPESRQGQGAFHASLFNNPDILDALRVGSSGALEVKDGGFEGPSRSLICRKLPQPLPL